MFYPWNRTGSPNRSQAHVGGWYGAEMAAGQTGGGGPGVISVERDETGPLPHTISPRELKDSKSNINFETVCSDFGVRRDAETRH